MRIVYVYISGYLLLWYSSHSEKPVVRQMSWLPNRHILSLCYDSTATWLLCGIKDALVVVPALALLVSKFFVSKHILTQYIYI
jgi:hypothetical protein